MNIRLLATAFVLIFASGCGGSSGPTTNGSQPSAATPTISAPLFQTAGELATAMKKKVAAVSSVIVYTEDNDPNNLIGRTNGYVSAALLIDDRSDECDKSAPGIECGAVIEYFKNSDAAKRRSKYILGILKDAPMFGSETHFISGKRLLRVSGVIKPSKVVEYESAWKSLT